MRMLRLAKKAALAVHAPLRPLLAGFGFDTKRLYELAYWKSRKMREGTLRNDWYEEVFTTLSGLTRDFYTNKRIIDIGCGPRGSLEWADMAAERVGLDPLVDDYRALGLDRHQMTYVCAPAEAIPFPDDHFHFVSSINSLDHVRDVDAVIRELIRVLRPGGTILLGVEVHPKATIAEPHALPWDLTRRFEPSMRVASEEHFEEPRVGHYLGQRIPFDHGRKHPRNGWLHAMLTKDGPSRNSIHHVQRHEDP